MDDRALLVFESAVAAPLCRRSPGTEYEFMNLRVTSTIEYERALVYERATPPHTLILDCGGKSDATPLFGRTRTTEPCWYSKAPSPLRSAGAVQEPDTSS